MNKAHFGLSYLTDLFRGTSGMDRNFTHTEFELELESKLKIIISIDENDSLAAIYFKTGGRNVTGSIKIRMQVSGDYYCVKFSFKLSTDGFLYES